MILKYRIDGGPAFTKRIILSENNPQYMTLLGDEPLEPLYGGVLFLAILIDGIVECYVFGMTSEGLFGEERTSIIQLLTQGMGITNVTLTKSKSTVTLLEMDITLEGQEDIVLAPVDFPVDILTCCHVHARIENLT